MPGTLIPTSQWVDVRHFAADAILTGGPDCPDNLPIQDLLDRTEYLKDQIASADLAAHEAAADPHPGYMTTAEDAAVMAAHAAEADPHPGYVSAAELAAALAALSIPTVFDGKSTGALYTGAALMTFAHGLGSAPMFFDAFVECVSAELGWSVGDVAKAPMAEGTGNYSLAVWADATNVYVRASVHGLMLLSKTDAAGSLASTDNKWKIFVRAS